MRTALAFVLLATRAAAAVLSIAAPATAVQGSTIQVAISITGTAGTGDQAVQFTLAPGWAVACSTALAGKSAQCADSHALVSGGVGLLADGQVATVMLTVPLDAQPGVVALGIVATMAAADFGGRAVFSALAGGSTSITILPAASADPTLSAAARCALAQSGGILP